VQGDWRGRREGDPVPHPPEGAVATTRSSSVPNVIRYRTDERTNAPTARRAARNRLDPADANRTLAAREIAQDGDATGLQLQERGGGVRAQAGTGTADRRPSQGISESRAAEEYLLGIGVGGTGDAGAGGEGAGGEGGDSGGTEPSATTGRGVVDLDLDGEGVVGRVPRERGGEA